MDEHEIFFENHPDPMFVFERSSLRFLAVNHATIKKYGYSEDEFLAMTIADIRPPEDLPIMRAALAGKEDGLAEKGTFRHRKKSGEIFDVDLTVHDVQFKGIHAELVMVHDVTRLLAAERMARAAIERESRQFRSLFEGLPGKFMVIEPGSNTVIAANDAYLNMLGVKRDDLVGHNLFETFPDDPNDPERNGQANLLASLQRAVANKLPDVMPMQRYSVERPASEGGGFVLRYWSVVNTPMINKDGTVNYIVHHAEELTDLFHMRLADSHAALTPSKELAPIIQMGMELLRRSEELKSTNLILQTRAANLRTAERLLRIGFWQVKENSLALSWSDTMFDIFGFPRSDTAPTNAEVLALIHPDDLPSLSAEIQRSTKKDPIATQYSFRVRRTTGEVIWLRGVSERSETAEGPVWNGVVQDVTEEMLAAVKLRDATEMEHMAAKLAHLGGWRLDLANQSVTWTGETAAIHGMPPGFSPSWELALSYIAPEYRDTIIRLFEVCARTGDSFDEVVQIISERGERVWVRATGAPERGPDGTIIAMKGAFQDISEFVTTREKSSQLSRRLAQTLEGMGEAFNMLDNEWRYTFVNAQAERLLGRDRSELLGKQVWEVFPIAEGSVFQDQCEQAIATGQPVRFVEYFPDPLNRWFDVGAHPTPDGLAIYFRDVTDEHLKTEQLRLLQLSVSHLNDMVIITEAHPTKGAVMPTIVYVNQAFARTTGYSIEEAIGNTPAMLMGPDLSRPEIQQLGETLIAGGTAKMELIQYTKKGDPYWAEVVVTPVFNDAGERTHLVSIHRDITERKHAEQTLKLSEERFRLVSNASNRVIWDYDFTTGKSWFNDNLEKFYGYGPSAEGPANFDWDSHIHPDDVARVRARLNAVAASDEKHWRDEYRMIKSDGSTAIVDDSGWLIRNEDGKALRMVGSFEDVTKAHDEEDRRRQSLKLEAMGQLTGGVAHDFNNLLTIILGNGEILMDTLTDEKQRELAKVTVGAAERAASLSRQLLAFARKQPLEPKQVDVDALIESVQLILKRALSERVVIRHVSAGAVWPAELDANQLEVALLNLAINARDAMPNGGTLTIATSNLDAKAPIPDAQNEVPPGEYVLISLTDTGTGMAPETLARAFEPFYSTKKAGLGSGLGLSMVYGFVKQSGGHIQIQSEIGHGTTCNLYFPRSQTATEREPQVQPPAAISGGQERILVVEDDPFVREHLVTQLGDLGYDVTSSENGDEALKVLQTDQAFDLLLTDIMMPGALNGKQLAQEALRSRPGLKVLFASGYSESTLVQDHRMEPGLALLSKPFRRKDLARKVRSVLDGT